MKIEYAIIIKSKTRLESLIDRFNTKAQAKFYIESSGGNFEDYELEHHTFHQSLNALQSRLTNLIKYKIIDKEFLSSFIFSENQMIIVIGRDGLVANTAKYANGIPIIAVNPDPDRHDGVLLPFDPASFVGGVEGVMHQQFEAKTVRFAEARLNDGQRLLAFNDLFIGAATHVSARYKISFRQKTEEHSSSGIIVSTQAGATGWMSSIFNMAEGLVGLFEQNHHLQRPQLKDNQLLFTVREPFKSVRTQTDVLAGLINGQNTLTIESLMPGGGVIFSDGIESDFLAFNSGAVVTVGVAGVGARLVLK
ncbi:MAG: sugar kinase [Saprospiraceae bacterium]|nr:MAG: sugar kinase [Saprospiraceae bacterium]